MKKKEIFNYIHKRKYLVNYLIYLIHWNRQTESLFSSFQGGVRENTGAPKKVDEAKRNMGGDDLTQSRAQHHLVVDSIEVSV